MPSLGGDEKLNTIAGPKTIDSPEQLLTTQHGKILFVEIPQLEISSTDIRRRCRHGLNITYLVPDGVAKIIKNNHLYVS